MAAKRKGLYEVRTRVTCHLPVNNQQEERALVKVIAYIRAQREQGLGVSGYTVSAMRPAAFQGWWWSDTTREWVADDIVLCLVDYQIRFNDPRLSAKVKELKRTIRKWYRHYGSPQEEVWVVAQQLIRED